MGNSLVYHFGSGSTKRIRQNKGRLTFLLKWGLTANTFSKYYLRIGQTFNGALTNTELPFGVQFINKLKRSMAVWKKNI
jgi:hypothetical protein